MCQAQVQDAGRTHRPPVALQLHHILGGVGPGRPEGQQQHLQAHLGFMTDSVSCFSSLFHSDGSVAIKQTVTVSLGLF